MLCIISRTLALTWNNTGDLSGARIVRDLALGPQGYLYAAANIDTGPSTFSARVFYSTDFQNWQTANTMPGQVEVLSSLIRSNSDTLFAGTRATGSGTYGGWLYYSADGLNWNYRSRISGGGVGTLLSCLLQDNLGRIHAGSDYLGMTSSNPLYSTDRGLTWLRGFINYFNVTNNFFFQAASNSLFLGFGFNGRLFRSSDGINWSYVTGPQNDRWAMAEAPGGKLYLGTCSGVAGWIDKSTDNGTSWLSVYAGLRVRSLCQASDGYIYAGTISGPDAQVLVSTDDGTTWNSAGTLSGATAVYRLVDVVAGGQHYLYAATGPNGDVFRALLGAAQTRDVGTTRISAPAGALDSGSTITPACSVYNYGAATESYTVRMKVGAGYNQTVAVSSHAPGALLYVTFPNWTAVVRGNSAVSCSTELSGDWVPANDKRTGTVTVEVGDVGTARLIAPAGTMDSGSTVTPACSVYNYGTRTPSSYPVRMRIGSGYSQTATVSGPAPGAALYVTFPGWTATLRGSNAVSCSTEYSADMAPANDKRSGSVDIAVHDLTAVAVVAPSGTIPPGPTIPQATVRNCGTSREACAAQFAITPAGYTQTVNLPAGLPFTDTVIDFPAWTAVAGDYTARCSTLLAGDQLPANNAVAAQFRVGGMDVGVTAITAPTGVHDTGDVLVPAARVRNFGEFAANFKAFLTIDPGADLPVFSDSIAVPTLSVGVETALVFSAWALPHPAGKYLTRCSTGMADDANPGNNVLADSFVIRTSGPMPETGWVRKTDLPVGPKGKRVKDGGCIASLEPNDTSFVYALKGNGRCEFYRYSATDNTWLTRESIPAYGSSGKKKAVKKGACMSPAPLPAVAAAKGNGTLEWWQYDPALSGSPTYPWVQMTDVPSGAKAIKEGAGAVMVQVADTGYIFFLKGSATQEFYRYSPADNRWQTLASAPLGSSGKPFKDGSGLAASEDGSTVFALKGGYNELFAYDVATNTWSSRAGMPLTGSSGRKKKVKSGAGIACHAGSLYALKGNNTTEFWSYQIDSNHWQQRADMPIGGGRRAKAGGALVYVPGQNALFALKGNNTLEFYKYGLPAYGLQLAANGLSQASAQAQAPSSGLKLEVSPTLFRSPQSAVRIDYALPQPGHATLTLYDIAGKLVTTLVSGRHNAGSAGIELDAAALPAGIYIVRLQSDGATRTRKLIVE
jgi:hypothetical protein